MALIRASDRHIDRQLENAPYAAIDNCTLRVAVGHKSRDFILIYTTLSARDY